LYKGTFPEQHTVAMIQWMSNHSIN